MDPLREPIQFRVGDDVYGSDEHKIGTVGAFDTRYLTVERGLLRKTQYYIPMDAVNNCAGGRCYLTVTKDEAENRGWDAPPPMNTPSEGAPITG